MIGNMNRRAQIQARSSDIDANVLPYRDGHAGDEPLWSTVATVWADIRPATGRDVEFMAANQVTEAIKYIVRYRRLAFPGITESHRIVFVEDASEGITRTLQIEAVRPDIAHDWMRLDCTEGEQDG